MGPRRSAPCTELTFFLNDPNNWIKAARTVPGLAEERLQRARNSRKGSEKNNDVLEFIGDRVVNLACALMIEKVKFCPDHQLTVNRVITNNDTLGRLAYQLQLQKRARLDPEDSLAVDNWSPRYCLSPPKVLADLFEAFVGAVYEEHGWDFTLDWLRGLFQPLLEKATEDFLKLANTQMLIQKLFVSHELLNTVNHQEKLYDYLDFKSKVFIEMAEHAIDALPPNTKFIFTSNGEIGNDRDMVEIASHLVKYWICKICMSLYPENREAFLKGPHLITSITTLVTNTWTLGYLGSMLSLSSFFDVDDVDYPAKNKRVTSPRAAGQEVSQQEAPYRTKLSYALYAMIGWYHSKDPKATEKWGIAWFKYIVIRAHDIIVEDPQYKPCLPSGADDTVAIHASAVENVSTNSKENFSSKEEELEAQFSAMIIQDAETRAKKGLSHFKLHLDTPHRLTIDLDEEEEENQNQNVNQRALAACGLKDDPVEGLVPSMKKLNLSNSKTINKSIKIALNEETNVGWLPYQLIEPVPEGFRGRTLAHLKTGRTPRLGQKRDRLN